jgi:hypothetical protein
MTDNQDRFDALHDLYGGYDKIPNDILYEYLIEVYEDLINLAKLGLDHIPNSNLGKEVRRRSIADLKWLAKYFLWDAMSVSENGEIPISNNIFLDPQYDIFAELFVKKDPSVPILQASSVKTRMLLWPRGGAKSSYDAIDTVQWVLCYPSIRILFLTAEASLSTGFISEIKGFFTLREDRPTLINLFFPEHCCLRKDMGAGNVFTTPVYKAKKTGRKEGTVRASSVGKTKAGWRFEVIKADDAVSDKNSETPTQCASISEKLFLAEKLLMPGGFYKEYIGTRYAEEEHYGVLLEKYLANGDIEKIEGVGWCLYKNKTHNINILIGIACQIKPEVAEKLKREGRPVTYIEAGEEGCILLLPKHQPYPWLMGEYTNNEKVFEGQLNQNPRSANDLVFPRDVLVRATIPYNMMPRYGPISQFWEMAFSQKKGVDFSVGSSVMWGEEDVYGLDGKKTPDKKTVGYIRQVVRDKFNPFSLAQAIVRMAVEERPFVLGIEKAAGSHLLEPTIIAEAEKTRDPQIIALCRNIDWVTVDGQKDAKKIRMGGLLPWLVEGRLKFANYCMTPKYPDLEVLYSEFERCMGAHHHDDIPDNLGYQPRYAPRASQAIFNNDQDLFSNVDRLGYRDIFAEENMSGDCLLTDPETGKVTMWSPQQTTLEGFTPTPEVPSETPHGLPNILGAGVWG